MWVEPCAQWQQWPSASDDGHSYDFALSLWRMRLHAACIKLTRLCKGLNGCALPHTSGPCIRIGRFPV
jgi:hypothetical protein